MRKVSHVCINDSSAHSETSMMVNQQFLIPLCDVRALLLNTAGENVLTLYTPKLVCIFSKLFSIHFLRC